MDPIFSQDFNTEGSFTQDFDTIGTNALNENSAKLKATYGALAVDNDIGTPTEDNIFGDLVTNGQSPVIDTVLTQEQNKKNEQVRSEFQTALDRITTNSTRSMNMEASLRTLGVILDPQAPTVRTAALAALARKPTTKGNPEAVRIQDQLSQIEPGRRLSDGQMLGITNEFGVGDFVFTSQERDRMAKQYLPVYDNTRSSLPNQVANFALGAFVPGPYSARRGYFFSQLFPDMDAKDFYNPTTAGLAIAEAKRRMNSMSRDELTTFLRDRMPSVLRTAANTGYEFNIGEDTDEDTQYMVDLYMTLMDDAADEQTSENVDIALNTAVGILDLYPLARGTVGKGLQLLKYLRRISPLENVARVDRVRAQELAQRAILAGRAGQDGLARSLRTTLADMINEYAMPKSPGSGSRAAFNLTDRWDISQTPNQAVDNSRAFLSPEERARFEQEARNKTKTSIADAVGDVHIADSEVGIIPGGVRTSTSVGVDGQHGFSTPSLARAIAESLMEEGSERLVTIEARNVTTGEVRTVTTEDLRLMDEYDQVAGRPELDPRQLVDPNSPVPRHPPRNAEEFTIKVQEDHRISPEHTLVGELDAAREGLTGKAAKWFNKYSVYKRYFANASSIAEADAEVVTQALRGVRETFMNLPRTSMKRADKILNDMDLKGVDMSLEEITRAADGDIEAVRGVLAVRRWADAMHFNTNRAARNELSAGGYRSFTASIGDRTQFFAKPVKIEEVPMAERIYSVQDNKAAVADEATRTQRAAEGWTAVRLRRPVRVGNQYVEYVWHNKAVDGTRVSKLPLEVVRRIPGYIPRVYDANYILARIVRGIDSQGRPYVGREPVSLHHNIEQANRDEAIRRGLAPSDDTTEYKVFGTRELIDNRDETLLSHLARSGLDYLEDSGRLGTSSRGNILRPMTEGAFSSERGPLQDIIESMEIAEFKVGNANMSKLVAIMTRRWEKEYADDFGVENSRTGKKEMPIWGEILNASDANVNRARYDKAVADRDHIRLIAGVDRTRHRMWWADRMRRISESLVTSHNPGDFWYNMGDKALRLKNSDLFSQIKRINFLRSIVWNPLRQLPLQFASSAMYMSTPHAIQYALKPNGLSRDFTAIVTYFLSKDLPGSNELFDNMAKKLGMTPNEYRELGEQFERTGFFQGIDSHSYAVGMYNSAQGAFVDSTRASTGIGRMLKNGSNFVRRVGFDTGERGNMLMGYLIERNRQLKEGIDLRNPDNFAQLIGDVRARTLNMGRTGTSALNQGAPGVMFQFMQYNMRVLQALLPEKALGRTVGKLADKSFTPAEKARMTFFLTAMFGTGGWGAANLAEDVTEWYSSVRGETVQMDPEVAETIREGIFGTAANWTLRSAFSDDSQVLVSSAFSPVAGIAGNLPDGDKLDSNPITRLYEGIMSQNPDALQELAGPAWVTYKAFRDQMKLAFAAMGVPFDGVALPFDPVQSPQLAIDAIGRIAPGYNNYVKGKAALQIGRFMDAQGDLGVEATEGEAYMKMLMGLESVEEVDLRQNLLALKGRAIPVRTPEDKDVRDAANTYYEHLKIFARRLGNGEIDQQQFLDAAMQEHWVVNSALEDPVAQWRFKNYIAEKIQGNLNNKGTDELVTLLSNTIQSGDIPSIPRSITRLNNMQSLDPKVREEMIQYMNVYMELFSNGRLQTEQPSN